MRKLYCKKQIKGNNTKNYISALIFASLASIGTTSTAQASKNLLQLNLQCELVSYDAQAARPYEFFVGVKEVSLYHSTRRYATLQDAALYCRDIGQWSCGSYTLQNGIPSADVFVNILRTPYSILYLNGEPNFPTITCDSIQDL